MPPETWNTIVSTSPLWARNSRPSRSKARWDSVPGRLKLVAHRFPRDPAITVVSTATATQANATRRRWAMHQLTRPISPPRVGGELSAGPGGDSRSTVAVDLDCSFITLLSIKSMKRCCAWRTATSRPRSGAQARAGAPRLDQANLLRIGFTRGLLAIEGGGVGREGGRSIRRGRTREPFVRGLHLRAASTPVAVQLDHPVDKVRTDLSPRVFIEGRSQRSGGVPESRCSP